MVGQVIASGRTGIAGSLYKKGCSMIGLLQKRRVSSGLVMDVVLP